MQNIIAMLEKAAQYVFEIDILELGDRKQASYLRYE